MSLPETIPTMHRLRPHWGHVTVLESPVDEEQRASGLIVPLNHQRHGEALQRGIVLHCSEYDQWGRPHEEDDGHGLLEQGTVVYFREGHRVGDVIVVNRSDVLAYVTEET